MKNGLKRIVAMLCAVAMIIGGCFVTGGNTTKASDTTEQKEWVVASQVGDITSTANHVGQIYRKMDALNIQLNADKAEDDYILYLKVYLQGDYAVECMENAYVELANNGDTDGEICWIPKYWTDNGIELKTGVNELYLPLDKFADANATGNSAFDVKNVIKYFRIYNISVSDCTGVILDEVKILDVSPVVQEYPDGATAGTAPEASSVPEGYVFAGWYTNKNCTSVLEGTTTNTAYAKFVNEKVLGVKAQYATHKGPQVIADCDGTDDIRFATDYVNTVTTVEGEFKEGNGAFKLADSNSSVRTWIYLNEPVDISQYNTSGYLHFWFYIEDPAELMTWLLVDIGHSASNMYRLKIAKGDLVSGWNDLYLPFEGGSVAAGSVDFTKIEMIRISQSSGTTNVITTLVDDICVVDSIPDVKIADCDTTGSGVRVTSSEVTTTAGRYREGKGAYILENTAENVRVELTISPAMDLSPYAKESICFDVYLNNPNSLYKNLIVDFGNDWSNMYRWVIPKAYLSTGWNEICLSIDQATKVGNVDLTQMDKFRLLQNGLAAGDTYTAMTTILDNVRVERTIKGKTIANCDTTGSGVTVASSVVTTALGRYREGKGAYILENAAQQVRAELTLNPQANLSKYADGCVCFDVYLSNHNSLYKNLIVDFGNDWSNMYRWIIPKAYLSTGWNEICLSIDQATKVGNVDLTQMDKFRLLQNGLAAGDAYTSMTTILDNVRVEKAQVEQIISNCDGTDSIPGSSSQLTTALGRYREGKGAYILENTAANVRTEVTLKTPANLSKYADGCVCFDVYLSNHNSLYKNLIVDFGNDWSNMYRWIIPKAYLSTGWNEICLSIDQATKVGNVDLTQMDKFRLLQNGLDAGDTYTSMTTILDNIRVEKEKVLVRDYADLRFVTTVDSLYYQNVGFKIEVGQKYIEPIYTEVYDTLYGVSNEKETLTFKPYVFAAESNYFNTHTLTNIPDTDFGKEIKVTPFWTTQDGTKVYGNESVTYTVNGMIEASKVKKTDLRVVMSSDIHYTSLVECYNGSGKTAAKARMQHWVDSIKKEHAKDPIDLLVLNGDLSLDYWDDIRQTINSWTGGESGMTKAFIDGYISQLPDEIAVWVMPGNHELYTDTKWNEITGNARQGFLVKDNNLFLFMDNYSGDLENKDQTSEATYTATNTTYIQEVMAANPDCDVYIISHYFDRNQESSLQTLLTNDTDKRIKGLFEGHTHGSKVFEWSNTSIARTGNFSYTFDTEGTDQPFWGFRELIITEDSAYSQYISVAGITGDEKTASYTRKTTDSVWYY